MERIASFCVDHNTLVPGMYLSRKDGDVLTWDIRMKTPNKGSYLSPAAEALALTQESFAWMAEYDGDIPGASAVECGNYLMMDPVAARLECKAMSEVLQKLDADHMRYQEK